MSADSDCEMDSRSNLISAGELVGDLTGGDRANVSLFKFPSSYTLRLFVAWVEHLSRLSEHVNSFDPIFKPKSPSAYFPASTAVVFYW